MEEQIKCFSIVCIVPFNSSLPVDTENAVLQVVSNKAGSSWIFLSTQTE